MGGNYVVCGQQTTQRLWRALIEEYAHLRWSKSAARGVQ